MYSALFNIQPLSDFLYARGFSHFFASPPLTQSPVLHDVWDPKPIGCFQPDGCCNRRISPVLTRHRTVITVFLFMAVHARYGCPTSACWNGFRITSLAATGSNRFPFPETTKRRHLKIGQNTDTCSNREKLFGLCLLFSDFIAYCTLHVYGFIAY